MQKLPLEMCPQLYYNKDIMAIKSAEIHTRIQPNVKRQAEQIFARTGHTASEAIEQFYVWTIKHQKTPMRLRKHVDIPDENLMTDAELAKMVESARKEVHEGKVTSLEEFKKEMTEEYGFKA